jgi:carnitine 3-dehydrogenase
VNVGLLGGGVIGGGWAARFLLNGADVRLYDPDPDAPRKVNAMLANARRAYARLTLAPLPAEGRLTFVATPEEAAVGADFVQESAPERVEVCGGRQTAAETLDRAAEVYRAVGMRPLRLSTEIDGFVADRLLEALWREALWLVHDGVATVEEVDDAIRFGPGLRWSIMGTFQIYRIAGGENGMRHFMAQFGPALEWPWTKLTDVPEVTDELLDRLETQSDEQAAGRSIAELERLRDDCLVSVLQALRGHDVGAGATLREFETALLARPAAAEVSRGEAPLRLLEARVSPDWIDYNGHASESTYLRLAGQATDALLARVGIDAGYLRDGGSYYTVETHLRHLGQAVDGELLRVTTQVLGADEKRLHVCHRVLRAADDEVLATAEHMLLHVDATSGRAGPAAPHVLSAVRRLADEHSGLPAPDGMGRRIEMPAAVR